MLAFVIFTTLALQHAAAAEGATKVEGKSTGHGYAYGHDDGYDHGGNSDAVYGNSYQGGYNNYGGYDNRQRDHGHSNHGHGYEYNDRHVPIQIPYLDRNGCTFPGDIVCNPADTDSTTYGYCVLSDESKNLWKKPSMEIVAATCAPAGAIVLSDWCNDNERLLRAVGFIKEKKENVYNHQRKYVVSLNPCVLVAPPA